MGRYFDCEESYPTIVSRHSPDGLDPEDGLDDWDGTWTHWWVRCGDWIADITADQFHPSAPEEYAVVVVPVGHPAYGGGTAAVPVSSPPRRT